MSALSDNEQVAVALQVDVAQVPIVALDLLEGNRGKITRTFELRLENGTNTLRLTGLSNNAEPSSISLCVEPGSQLNGEAVVTVASQFILGDGQEVSSAGQEDLINVSNGASGCINAAIDAPGSGLFRCELTYVAHPVFWLPEYEIYDSSAPGAEGGKTTIHTKPFKLRYCVNIFQFTGEPWTDLLTISTATDPAPAAPRLSLVDSTSASPTGYRIGTQDNIPLSLRSTIPKLNSTEAQPDPEDDDDPYGLFTDLLTDNDHDNALQLREELESAIIRAQDFLTWQTRLLYRDEFTPQVLTEEDRRRGTIPPRAPYFPRPTIPPQPASSDSSELSSKNPSSFASRRPPLKLPQASQILHSLPEQDRRSIPRPRQSAQGQARQSVAENPIGASRSLTLQPPSLARTPSPSLSTSTSASTTTLGGSSTNFNTAKDSWARSLALLGLVVRADTSNVIRAQIADDNEELTVGCRMSCDVVLSSPGSVQVAMAAAEDKELEREVVASFQVQNTSSYDLLPGPLAVVLSRHGVYIKDLFTEHVPTEGTISCPLKNPSSHGIYTKVTSKFSIVAESTHSPPLPTTNTQSNQDQGPFHTFSRTYIARTTFTNSSPFPTAFELVEDGMGTFNVLAQDLVGSSSDVPGANLPPFNMSQRSKVNTENGSLDFVLEQPQQAFKNPGETVDVEIKPSNDQANDVKATWKSKSIHPETAGRFASMKLPPLLPPSVTPKRASAVDLRVLFWSFLPLANPGLQWRVVVGPSKEGGQNEEGREEVESVWRLSARVNRVLLTE